MKNDYLCDAGSQVYPGTYVPLVNEEGIRKEFKLRRGNTPLLPVDVTDEGESFNVDITIPGAKRESFLIHADENILTVHAVLKEDDPWEKERILPAKSRHQCFDYQILLPEYADSVFISAEYRDGILHLHVPKTTIPVKNDHTRIAVY